MAETKVDRYRRLLAKAEEAEAKRKTGGMSSLSRKVRKLSVQVATNLIKLEAAEAKATEARDRLSPQEQELRELLEKYNTRADILQYEKLDYDGIVNKGRARVLKLREKMAARAREKKAGTSEAVPAGAAVASAVPPAPPA